MSNQDIIVEGPEELTQTLIALSTTGATHFIHYKQGKQQALIKITPQLQILHYDLHGRSATEAVKKSVEAVMRDCGQKNACFEDVSRQDMLNRNRDFLSADTDNSRVILSEVMTLEDVRLRLNQMSSVILANNAPCA